MRLPAKIRAALEATGKEWTLVQGTRHIKIRVGGKFVGILPGDGRVRDDRATKNVISQIRRGGG